MTYICQDITTEVDPEIVVLNKQNIQNGVKARRCCGRVASNLGQSTFQKDETTHLSKD